MRRFQSMLLAATVLLAGSAFAAEPTSKPVSWSTKDTKGAAVSVPADKPTVLVFARPDQAQSRKAIEQVTQAVKGRGLQVVAVVSGEDAVAAAAGLEGNWSFPVVTDANYAAKNLFGIRAWPTTVVVLKDGTQAAHIAGMPASFGRDLEAYLEFSAGKLDKAGLEKRLTAADVIADSASQKAARHLEVAQRLIEKGMRDQAKTELAKAVEFKPSEPALQIAIARTYLMVGDAKGADAILATAADANVPSSEISLLKGWSALQAQKWDAAKNLLTEAAKLNPQPAEACYLLGLVYQHEGDNAKASENFRKAFEHTAIGKALSAGQ